MTRTIMAVVAHPDDVELTCGGSIICWTRKGDHAILVMATDGARGAKHAGPDGAGMAATRRAEQQAAAAVLGFGEIVELGFPDGELVEDDRLRAALVEHVRRVRPDVVVAMDPLTVIFRNSYVNHRDHRVLGMAVLDSLYPQASNVAFYPEQLERGLEPHKVPELLLVQSEHPNYWVDVSGTLEERFRALRCHASQLRLWPENGEVVIRQQREYAAALGVEHGVRYAEAFRRIAVNPLT